MTIDAKKDDTPTFITDDMEIIAIFQSLKLKGDKVWAWQQGEIDDKRIVHFVIVKRVDAIKKIIGIAPFQGKELFFSKNREIFIYSPRHFIAVKVIPITTRENLSQFNLPKKLSICTPEMVQKINLLEKADGEDEGSVNVKEPLRFNGSEKVVCIQSINKLGERTGFNFYPLNEISREGIKISLFNENEFSVMDSIEIIRVGNKALKNPIMGIVQKIDPLDESGSSFEAKIKYGQPQLSGKEKVVCLQKIDEEGLEDMSNFFTVVDHFTGGISISVDDPSLFAAGDTVQFIRIGNLELSEVLLGTVKSVTQIAGIPIEFKVGIAFNT